MQHNAAYEEEGSLSTPAGREGGPESSYTHSLSAPSATIRQKSSLDSPPARPPMAYLHRGRTWPRNLG